MFAIMFTIVHKILQQLFVLKTALELYLLGALYVLKELDRKTHLFGKYRRLDEDDQDLNLPMDGMLAIITGGSRGIGLEAGMVLLRKGCQVIIASSSGNEFRTQLEKKLNDEMKVFHSKSNLKSKSKLRVRVWHLNLSSLESVKAFLERLGDTQVNILINNAAIMFGPKNVTSNGFESHFQVNYLGHSLLIWSLLPSMRKASISSGRQSRIVNVSSSTHFARNLNINDLQSTGLYSPFDAYAKSKLAQIMFTYKMDEWLRRENTWGDHISVNALHPGVVKTDLYEHVWWVQLMPWMAKLVMRVR